MNIEIERKESLGDTPGVIFKSPVAKEDPPVTSLDSDIKYPFSVWDGECREFLNSYDVFIDGTLLTDAQKEEIDGLKVYGGDGLVFTYVHKNNLSGYYMYMNYHFKAIKKL